jgi:hypothetical protein
MIHSFKANITFLLTIQIIEKWKRVSNFKVQQLHCTPSISQITIKSDDGAVVRLISNKHSSLHNRLIEDTIMKGKRSSTLNASASTSRARMSQKRGFVQEKETLPRASKRKHTTHDRLGFPMLRGMSSGSTSDYSPESESDSKKIAPVPPSLSVVPKRHRPGRPRKTAFQKELPVHSHSTSNQPKRAYVSHHAATVQHEQALTKDTMQHKVELSKHVTVQHKKALSNNTTIKPKKEPSKDAPWTDLMATAHVLSHQIHVYKEDQQQLPLSTVELAYLHTYEQNVQTALQQYDTPAQEQRRLRAEHTRQLHQVQQGRNRLVHAKARLQQAELHQRQQQHPHTQHYVHTSAQTLLTKLHRLKRGV